MINKFEKQLEKWNNGVLRGAQAKLAKHLHVSTATVALWATGKRHPSKGYLNQLARIFGMDAYDVARLFGPNTPLSGPLIFPTNSTGLHESRDFSITYSTDKIRYDASLANSLVLPLFIHLPSNLPNYQPSQVDEWWTLPRRAVLGAQFLILATETDLPLSYALDTLFIRPVERWIEGELMLARLGEKYLIRRIVPDKNKLKWQKEKQQKQSIPLQAKPIGIVVERLTSTLF